MYLMYFYTVDHDILIQKLNHSGIRGVAENWLSPYLQNRYVVINAFNPNFEQGSILGPLLFLIFINDPHCAIRHCSVYHFEDDTNLLNSLIQWEE